MTTDTYRALIVPGKMWTAMTDWLHASGVELLETPFAPGQMPRYAVNPRSVDNLQSVPAKDELTEREMQVLTGMAGGLTNSAIARQLYLSEDTVKTHARRLFRKLGVTERAGAVAAGFRRGLLR